MHTSSHICPFGLRAKDLLEREGFKVDDQLLKSREQTDEFKAAHNVDTTPQIFINDQQIGGYEALREHLGKPSHKAKKNVYWPVISIFLVALLVTFATRFPSDNAREWVMSFIGFSMLLLAVQKIRDIHSFTNSFITYDVLAMRHLRYAYIYPYLELYAGVCMLTALPAIYYAPIAIFIGLIGAVSVFKAVYLDKRELKCACVGGDTDVPLGFISLTENVAMLGAGVFMLIIFLTKS
ncbi:glutaredoxin [Pseudoalteromonas amylolytica]|uniref:Methylamine utilization protein MauE n=2 Tax=Pseudoalteromonas TaxID=53246 RepID=A0A1S1MRZ3_9GAMM|nr:glutaredoxin [Pseudoalteromonas sp. JW3]OHU89015.1 glutaredoxin [Pseudoalteromonas amylolytica]